MTRTTRTRITIQTERVLVMSHRSLYGLCIECGDEVRMATIDQASAMVGVSSREIYREIESGNLHFMETPQGSVLVCFNSLNDSNLRMKG